MYKKLLSVLVCIAVLLTVLAGCASSGKDTTGKTAEQPATTTDKSTESKSTDDSASESASESTANAYEKKYKITVSSLNLVEGADFQDPMMKFFQEKFNVEFELFPVGWGDWNSKTSVWISSGDMPDITFWNYNYSEYVNYVDQGLIKALPDGYETRYPNLEAVLKLTKIADFLKGKMGGKLYMVPKVIFKDLPVDINTNHLSIWYRKDWAKKVGMEIGDTISFKQIEELSKAFQEQDPGGNGAGNTVGLATDPRVMTQVYMPAFNLNWSNFYKKDDGTYTWGAIEPATLEGLKYMQQLYKSNVFYKDYYTIKSESDYWQLFYSGKTGMVAGSNFYGFIPEVMNNFGAANPGLDPKECVGVTTFTDNSGKWNGKEMANFWSACLFNPNMEDDKMERILAIMDYIATDEGQEFVNLGFLGQDYTKDGGKITITRAKDDKGNFKPMQEIYPCYWAFSMMVVLTDNFGVNDPSVPQEYRDLVTEQYKFRAQGNIRPLDWEMEVFSADNYNKFQLKSQDNLSEAFTQLILKEGDLEKNFEEWVNSVKTQVDDCLKEINDALGKK